MWIARFSYMTRRAHARRVNNATQGVFGRIAGQQMRDRGVKNQFFENYSEVRYEQASNPD